MVVILDTDSESNEKTSQIQKVTLKKSLSSLQLRRGGDSGIVPFQACQPD